MVVTKTIRMYRAAWKGGLLRAMTSGDELASAGAGWLRWATLGGTGTWLEKAVSAFGIDQRPSLGTVLDYYEYRSHYCFVGAFDCSLFFYFFFVLFTFLSRTGKGKTYAHLTTLPCNFIHVVCRFNSIKLAIQR